VALTPSFFSRLKESSAISLHPVGDFMACQKVKVAFLHVVMNENHSRRNYFFLCFADRASQHNLTK